MVGEGHRVRGLGVVVSCGGSGEKGWRTELNLGSGQSLEDPHRPTTVRAEPQRGFFLVRGWRCVWLELSWGHGAEGLEAKRQQGRPLAVGEEAEVTNADEAFGEQVQQEAAQG